MKGWKLGRNQQIKEEKKKKIEGNIREEITKIEGRRDERTEKRTTKNERENKKKKKRVKEEGEKGLK